MAIPERSPFSNNSLREHLIRGGIGISAMSFAVILVAKTGGAQWAAAAALALVALSLFALRGCPMCWTIGLVETFAAARKRRRGVQAVGSPQEPDIMAGKVPH